MFLLKNNIYNKLAKYGEKNHLRHIISKQYTKFSNNCNRLCLVFLDNHSRLRFVRETKQRLNFLYYFQNIRSDNLF